MSEKKHGAGASRGCGRENALGETNEFDVRTASSTENVNCRGWAATSAKKLLETKKAGVVA
ncbi:hypothetical protein [Caballeronia cordobensis]|uniref:hypothetical protein n=2 Tax=Burkholderiaceae TaxID=119060 RepID=UPI001177D376|nr:hypothetical protein [Caballeronia cordobensis]